MRRMLMIWACALGLLGHIDLFYVDASDHFYIASLAAPVTRHSIAKDLRSSLPPASTRTSLTTPSADEGPGGESVKTVTSQPIASGSLWAFGWAVSLSRACLWSVRSTSPLT